MKLTDTHLVLLSAAAQHPHKLLVRPENLAGSAARKVAAKLIRAGLVEEVTVKPDQPHWLMNDGDDPVGLRITPAGLSAIGIEDETPGAEEDQPWPVPDAAVHQPRPGTKQALIVDLLHREEGASLDDLIAATGWLPHTTRAALTGLRQRGHVLAKSKGEDGRTRYRISAAGEPSPEAASQAQEG